MDILYRRFILVSAFIAVAGVLVANVIVETRRPVSGSFAAPAQETHCGGAVLCSLNGRAGNVATLERQRA